MAQDVFAFALLGMCGYFLATVVSNIAYFRSATKPPRVRSGPFVSVVVPVRNEERSVARCVTSLLEQDYADFEVVVVDDESSDATPAILRELAGDPRLRVVCGAPLPDGWLGKPHALFEGSAAARGEILLLTDADTFHRPDSISWAVTNLQDHDADLVSGYVDQEYGGLGESLIVPVLYAMMMVVPFALLPLTRSARLAFSIGQFVAVRREALDDVGGFEAIKDAITDDMAMAARMKEYGHRNVFLDARRVATCRMYEGRRQALKGIERSIYSAVGGRPLTAAAIAATVFAGIVAPAAWVLFARAGLPSPPLPVIVSVALFATQWTLVAWNRHVPAVAVLLYPLVFAGLLVMLAASVLNTGYGPGVEWKGRLVRIPHRARVLRAPKPAERS